jgi:hypothetical protein
MANAISSITLCNVNITPIHQIDFADVAAQTAYFYAHKKQVFEKCRYQPRTATIKVKGYVDTLQNCNYGYYTNTYNGTNKTFYFWIVKKDYRARETTELTIQIDVFQTWLFDFNFTPFMIERTHAQNDNIGDHTLPEDFELGDYVTYLKQPINCLCGNPSFFVGVTDIGGSTIGGVFGKTYSGFAVKYYKYDQISALSSYITDLCNQGKGDAIAFIFSFPEGLWNGSGMTGNGDTIVGCDILGAEQSFNFSDMIKNFAFRDQYYSPYNNKIYTYPYNFITVKNANGGNVVLKLENFQDYNNIKFAIQSVLVQNPTISCTPEDYDGKAFAIDDGIEMNDFGLCSWNNDNYSNWFAQHVHSINAQSANAANSYNAKTTVNDNNYSNALSRRDTAATKGAINTAISTASALGHLNFLGAIGNAAGGAANTYLDYGQATKNADNDLANSDLLNNTNYQNTIASILASVKDAQVQPNTCKGSTASCGLDLARNTATFFLEQTAIKPEYARIIDMYWQMFGYKMNRVDVPTFKSRVKWNYLKTTNCSVFGNMPHEDMEAINQMFNNGLTVWHDESYMYNYNTINAIK